MEQTNILNERKKGMTIIVEGQPPIGDNATIMLYLLNDISVRQGNPSAYFAPGMTSTEITDRLIGINAGVDHGKIVKGELGGEEWQKVNKCLPMLINSPLYIDDTKDISLSAMKRSIDALAKNSGVRLVVVNPVNRITVNGQKFSDEQARIDHITAELKALSEELNIVVFAVER